MQVAAELNGAIPRILPATFDYMDSAMDVEHTMRSALQVHHNL